MKLVIITGKCSDGIDVRYCIDGRRNIDTDIDMELLHYEIRHQLYKPELGLSLLIVCRYENEVKQMVCLSSGGVCGV